MSQIQLMIIDSDDESRQKIRQYLESDESVEVIGDFADAIEGYKAVLQEKPGIVLIDVSENTDLMLELVNKISIQLKHSLIFVMSYQTTADIVIKAMRAGAREFITKPVELSELDSAIKKSKNIISDDPDKEQCKVFTVFSNKGGIGKTSIATNLAVNLADVTGKKVALIDLNLQLGDVTTFLDINPSFDIAYVVTHLNRVDESFMLSTLEKYKNRNLYILADPPYLEQAEEITAEQISKVLEVLKSTFSYIIIDTSSSFDGKTLSALDISDAILLVSMVNLPSIRNTQRCLDLFSRLGYSSDKIKLIVNRYMPDDEIKVEDVEDVLKHPIFWKIPNNYFEIMSSINKGIPVSDMNPSANVSQCFRELAALLSNTVIIKEDLHKRDSQSNSIIFSLLNKLPFFNKLISSKN